MSIQNGRREKTIYPRQFIAGRNYRLRHRTINYCHTYFFPPDGIAGERFVLKRAPYDRHILRRPFSYHILPFRMGRLVMDPNICATKLRDAIHSNCPRRISTLFWIKTARKQQLFVDRGRVLPFRAVAVIGY